MVGIAFARGALKHIAHVTRTTTTTATRRRFSILLPTTPTPWLRLPIDTTDSSFVEFDNFYNIVDKRFVKLDIGKAYAIGSYILCVGSSRGSLAFVCQNGRLYFGYPHAGGGYKYNKYGDLEFDDDEIRKEIRIDTSNSGLHSLTRFYTTLRYVETFLCYPRCHPQNPTPNNYHDFYVKNEDTTVFVNWTRYPNLFHKDDPPIVYCEKTKTAYKLSCYVFEPRNEIGTVERELRARCHQDRYLVLTGDEGGRGEPVLYLVVRHHNRELGVSQTRAMDVFRFDLVAGKMSYTTELDDHAFFIGQGSDSFAIPVEQCRPRGLKPDSVYIADDLRVFDLKDGSITLILDTGDLSMTRFQSLWIPPPTKQQIEEGKEWRRTEGDVDSTI